jgi:hypothetical protein
MVDPSLIAGHLSADGAATVAGVGFHESVSTIHLQYLAVGTHAVSDQKVLVTDLSRLRSADLHIQGILGEDFLQHFDMLIDNAHGLLCLDETGTMQTGMKGSHIPLSEPSQSITGNALGKSLIMSVHFFNGMRPVRLMLDSGSNTPFLYGPSDYLAFGVVEGASWHGMGANGQQQAFVALPPQDMRINDVALSGVTFLALRSERKASHASAFDGLLPTGLFKRVFVSQNGEFAVLEPRF